MHRLCSILATRAYSFCYSAVPCNPVLRGLGQALKQSAQRFRSMFWLTKGIVFASQEMKSVGFSWVCGPRQKDFGLEGCGRKMSDTWSSEIQKYAYGVMFQSLVFQRLSKLKKTKGLDRILPSDRGLPRHRLQSSSSGLQNLPWFRSVDLGFGCCGLWFEFRVLGEFLLEFVELGFQITLEFESLSSSV